STRPVPSRAGERVCRSNVFRPSRPRARASAAMSGQPLPGHALDPHEALANRRLANFAERACPGVAALAEHDPGAGPAPVALLGEVGLDALGAVWPLVTVLRVVRGLPLDDHADEVANLVQERGEALLLVIGRVAPIGHEDGVLEADAVRLVR